MPEPIHVAFSIDTMEAGGTELNAVRLAERLNRDRFDIRVVCMRKEGPLAARYEALGVPVESFPMRSLFGPSAVRQGVRLARYLRTQRIAIVHAHDIYSNVFAVPWARLAGARTIASRRWWEGFQATRWRLATRMSYRAAHAVLANSTAIGRLVEAEGVPPSRVVVVPNFLDEAAFERPDEMTAITLGRELRLDDGGPVVGIVANLLPVKDHAALLRAAVILRPRWPGSVWCWSAMVHAGRRWSGSRSNSVWVRRSCLPDAVPAFPTFTSCSISRCCARRAKGYPTASSKRWRPRARLSRRRGAVADAVLDGETGFSCGLPTPCSWPRRSNSYWPIRRAPHGTARRERPAPERTIRRMLRWSRSRVYIIDSSLARSVATVAPPHVSAIPEEQPMRPPIAFAAQLLPGLLDTDRRVTFSTVARRSTSRSRDSRPSAAHPRSAALRDR